MSTSRAYVKKVFQNVMSLNARDEC